MTTVEMMLDRQRHLATCQEGILKRWPGGEEGSCSRITVYVGIGWKYSDTPDPYDLSNDKYNTYKKNTYI